MNMALYGNMVRQHADFSRAAPGQACAPAEQSPHRSSGRAPLPLLAGAATLRVAQALFKDPWQFSARSRGRKLVRECCVCGYRGRFLSVERGLRLDSRCPGCGCRERHRLQHLFLTEDGGWKLEGQRVLHFAPERYMRDLMRGNPLYVTADLSQPTAEHRIDATSIPFADASFDVLIAHHILEHIDDDARALAEFARVLRPGGFALLSVPQNHAAEYTDEDSNVQDPMARFWRFTGFDHRRLYGRDFPQRVAAAGFAVRPYIRSAADQLRYALLKDEVIYVAERLK
jgi:hypothetical protein